MSVQAPAVSRASLGELWLTDRMADHGARVAVTLLPTAEARRGAIREAIVGRGIDQVICGRAKDGKTNTYAQAFERLYGEKL